MSHHQIEHHEPIRWIGWRRNSDGTPDRTRKLVEFVTTPPYHDPLQSCPRHFGYPYPSEMVFERQDEAMAKLCSELDAGFLEDDS